MRYLTKSAHAFVLVLLALSGCLPERMPPAPVETNRPLFKNFDPSDSTTIAVPLRDPVVMNFNETMDLRSFDDNFSLFSTSGEIPGTFSQNDQDSTVTFTPSQDMYPAEIHIAEIRGGVKDIHGNSMSIEEDFAIRTWFFTEGEYSRDGYAHIYVTDRVEDKIHVIGQFDHPVGEITSVQRPRGLAITPDGSRLLVVNNISNGRLSVFDAATEQKLADVAVGRGPTDVETDGINAYVVNLSAKTISVVSLASLSEITVVDFPDGFRPRHIALAGGKLFLTSNNLSDKGTVKILDQSSLAELETLRGVLVNQRSATAEASSDGRVVYIPEERSPRIAIIEVAGNAVLPAIASPVPQNTDAALGAGYAFVGVNGGMIFKIDLATHAVVDSVIVDTNVEGVALVAGGEILYATTPNDTSVMVFETNTMTRLGRAVLGTTIQKLAAGKVKF